VRIYCTQVSARNDNYSLYDFNVYGTPVTDLAQGRPAYSSTIESSYYTPAMAVDGNSGTRWSSGQWMQQSGTGWIYVDLGASININEVRLNWETAYAVNYQIQVSNDALNWTTIDNIVGNQTKGIADFSGLSGIGRYVRIYCTQVSAGSDNYSLYDFQVFGTPVSLATLQPAGALTTLATNTQTTSVGSYYTPPAASAPTGGTPTAAAFASSRTAAAPASKRFSHPRPSALRPSSGTFLKPGFRAPTRSRTEGKTHR
jgi:hypothetical protein